MAKRLSTDLPENADLLVLDENVSGTDQLKDLLDQNILSNPYTKIAIIAKEDADCVYFGSQELTFAGLSDEISTLRHSSLIDVDTSTLFRNQHKLKIPFIVYAFSESSDLEQYARGLIQSSFESSAFLAAVESAFSPSKHIPSQRFSQGIY